MISTITNSLLLPLLLSNPLTNSLTDQDLINKDLINPINNEIKVEVQEGLISNNIKEDVSFSYPLIVVTYENGEYYTCFLEDSAERGFVLLVYNIFTYTYDGKCGRPAFARPVKLSDLPPPLQTEALKIINN